MTSFSPIVLFPDADELYYIKACKDALDDKPDMGLYEVSPRHIRFPSMFGSRMRPLQRRTSAYRSNAVIRLNFYDNLNRRVCRLSDLIEVSWKIDNPCDDPFDAVTVAGNQAYDSDSSDWLFSDSSDDLLSQYSLDDAADDESGRMEQRRTWQRQISILELAKDFEDTYVKHVKLGMMVEKGYRLTYSRLRYRSVHPIATLIHAGTSMVRFRSNEEWVVPPVVVRYTAYDEWESVAVVCKNSRVRRRTGEHIRAIFKPRDRHSTKNMYSNGTVDLCGLCVGRERAKRRRVKERNDAMF